MTTEADDPWNALAEPSTRTPRTFETREHTQRKRSWVEPSSLPDPTPRDGYVFKWCRTATMNVADTKNYQKRVREGWEPVDAADHPELMLELSVGQMSGKVEVGGLILCKMPEEWVAQRRAYYRDRTAAKMDAAEHDYLRENSEVVKKFQEKQRSVMFGR